MSLKKYILVLFIITSVSGCAKWKVSNLTKNVLLNIPIGREPGKLDVNINDSSYVDITFDVRVSNDRIYCADNTQKRFQVFNLQGKPELVIGNPEVKVPKSNAKIKESPSEETEETDATVSEDTGDELEVTPFSFGYIGKFVADKNGLIYIQNTLLSKESRKDPRAPSNILVFNNKGKILYSLGKGGAADVPFYSLFQMYTDDKSRLFVVSKSYDNWSVDRYDGKIRDFTVNFSKDDFKVERDGESYSGLVEEIIPFNSGTTLLLSVAYYDSTRFKFRKIYEYHVQQKKLGKQIAELLDPRNELFTILEDKYIVLWDIDKKDIRFAIWNLQDSIVNNLRIDIQTTDYLYQKILSDEQGRLYTMVLTPESVEIKEWK
jgi:hypothetical protein